MADNQQVLSALDGFSAKAKSTFSEIRAGDLKRFISAQPDVRSDVQLGPIEYLREGAGGSNGIGFFELTLNRGGGLQTEQMVLRYATGFRLLKQKSFSDEFWTLRAADQAGLPVPSALWLDANGDALGLPCYIASRVIGRSPPMNFMSGGPVAKADPQARKQMLLEVAAFHGHLKRIAIDVDAVPHLAGRGTGATAIERELSWWLRETSLIPRVDPYIETIETAYKWLIEHQPAPYSPRLAHGDAQIANVMFNEGRLAAVIDWELAHLGYNEPDLALVVHHSELVRQAPDGSDGIPSEAEYIATFERESGSALSAWSYFKAFIRFKAATATYLARSMMPDFGTVWESQIHSLHAAIAEAAKG